MAQTGTSTGYSIDQPTQVRNLKYYQSPRYVFAFLEAELKNGKLS